MNNNSLHWVGPKQRTLINAPMQKEAKRKNASGDSNNEVPGFRLLDVIVQVIKSLRTMNEHFVSVIELT